MDGHRRRASGDPTPSAESVAGNDDAGSAFPRSASQKSDHTVCGERGQLLWREAGELAEDLLVVLADQGRPRHLRWRARHLDGIAGHPELAPHRVLYVHD